MVFKFGFQFGNKWFGLCTSSLCFRFGISLKYFCFGVGIDGFGLLLLNWGLSKFLYTLFWFGLYLFYLASCTNAQYTTTVHRCPDGNGSAHSFLKTYFVWIYFTQSTKQNVLFPCISMFSILQCQVPFCNSIRKSGTGEINLAVEFILNPYYGDLCKILGDQNWF